jgi:hypothetical protein
LLLYAAFPQATISPEELYDYLLLYAAFAWFYPTGGNNQAPCLAPKN